VDNPAGEEGVIKTRGQNAIRLHRSRLQCDWKEALIMSAYFVVQATITNEPQYQKYREAVVPFIAKFGGKIVARGAKVEVFEGEHDTRPVVMFEFPTMEAIQAFWNSPDYAPIKKLREDAATINVWAFPGI
jgi:uncharacterized protein (DUF1330 family)